MIKIIKIQGVKNLVHPLEWDLKALNLDHNSSETEESIIKNGIVYGKSGSGKTTLFKFLYAMIRILKSGSTDNSLREFINLNNPKNLCFEVELFIDNHEIVYKNELSQDFKVLSESLFNITTNELIFDRNIMDDLSDTITFVDLQDNEFMLSKAALFNSDEKYRVMKRFMNEIKSIYVFSGIASSNKIDILLNSVIDESVMDNVVKTFNKINDEYKLTTGSLIHDNEKFLVKFKTTTSTIGNFLSSGTKNIIETLLIVELSLVENTNYLFIDEFDSYENPDISEHIYEILCNSNFKQIFVSTHNTNLIDNSNFNLKRKDTVFILQKNTISNISKLYKGVLRNQHNYEAIFHRGGFELDE